MKTTPRVSFAAHQVGSTIPEVLAIGHFVAGGRQADVDNADRAENARSTSPAHAEHGAGCGQRQDGQAVCCVERRRESCLVFFFARYERKLNATGAVFAVTREAGCPSS